MDKYLKLGLLIFGGTGLFCAGMFIEKKRINSKIAYCGVLRIDTSLKDESPMLFCELSIPPDKLKNMEVVSFKIIKENYIREENNDYNEQR